MQAVTQWARSGLRLACLGWLILARWALEVRMPPGLLPGTLLPEWVPALLVEAILARLVGMLVGLVGLVGMLV